MKHLKLKDKPGKLCPQYIGPFKVLQMVGRNAAKLELPPGMKVHPVFNVALLEVPWTVPITKSDISRWQCRVQSRKNTQALWASPILLVLTKMERVWARGRYVGP